MSLFTTLLQYFSDKVNPISVPLGVFKANLDETDGDKLKRIPDHSNVGGRISDGRKGAHLLSATAVRFPRWLSRRQIERWCWHNRKDLAGIRESIDIICQLSPSVLQDVLPLVVARQSFGDEYMPVFFPSGKAGVGYALCHSDIRSIFRRREADYWFLVTERASTTCTALRAA